MHHGPEWKIQQKLIEFLRIRGWLVKPLIGNKFQTGMPDLFCWHRKHGLRLIDVKNPARYTFTRAQRHDWPQFAEHGLGVWILTAATQEQYDLLFAPANWQQFWKRSWNLEIDDVERFWNADGV